MKVRLQERFKTMVHGVQAGYIDPETNKTVNLGLFMPGQVREVPDKQAAELLKQTKCFEDAGIPKKEPVKPAPEKENQGKPK